MFIIWRGFGIIVPILFVGIGYVVSLFYDDRRLGNTDLMGWTLFYCSILFLILGLSFALSSEEERNQTGKKWTLWHHTFFFVPVLFWGILSLIFCVYFLLIYNPNKEEAIDASQLNIQVEEQTTVHFYNPTDDSLYYVFIDEYGTNEKVLLADYMTDEQLTSGEDNQANLIAALDLSGNQTLRIEPENPDQFDKNKFSFFEEDGSTYFMRKIKKPTAATNDVDDVWVLLDARYSLALVNVSSLYVDGTLNRESIGKTNWMEKIYQKYKGNDIIQLDVKNPEKHGEIHVVNPNTGFPDQVFGKTKVYFLIDFLDEKDLSNKYLYDEIMRLTEPDSE